MIQAQNINIKLLEINKGQIEGLPKNPRFIRDNRFDSLKKSIESSPEMLELRELIVYPFNDGYVIIGGNMRLRAMQELGFKECPCKVLPKETTIDKLKEYIIKDNRPYGQDDMEALANEWDQDKLIDWGFEEFELTGIEEKEKVENNNKILPTKFDVIIECQDEIEQEKLFNKFNNEGFKCRVFTL